jgi:hypothetical protein
MRLTAVTSRMGRGHKCVHSTTRLNPRKRTHCHVFCLQLVDFPEASGPRELQYDAEWLAVLRTTHGLLSLQRRPVALPGAPEA